MILTYGNEYKFDDVCIHLQLPKHTAKSAVWEECLALHLFGFDSSFAEEGFQSGMDLG
jgi:hypothetical protein